MKAAYLTVSKDLLLRSLHFPPGTDIIAVEPSEIFGGKNFLQFKVVHPTFPEVVKEEDTPHVQLTFRVIEAHYHFEGSK